MKLKKLIELLQKEFERHGDIEVYLLTPEDEHEIQNLCAHYVHGDQSKAKVLAIQAEGVEDED